MRNNTHKPLNNQGFAATIAVLAITSLALITVGSMSATLISKQKIVRNALQSTQSYYTAEAGIEDALLRLIDSSIPEQTSMSLSLAGSTASTDIVQVGNDVTISSSGDTNNFFRNLQVSLTANTDGASFNYGIQVGAGGVEISKSGVVIDGNIYSDGNIVGENSPTITGDAWASGAHTISGFRINKSAHAHTLTNDTIGLDAYYTNKTGGSVGRTSYPGSADPPTQSMPIDDALINSWKQAAADGEVFTGNKVITTNTDLGPMKIVGNLTISSGAVVNLVGTIWVTGDIVVQNNFTAIQLDSGYGTNSGVIIADGFVSMQNSVRICGSEGFNTGTKVCNTKNGSYVMLVSTDTGENTMHMQNGGSLNGILYAPYGELTLENNVSVKSATAYKMEVENNTTVTYEEGLVNMSFSSGPSGGWNIGRWQEVR